MNNIYSKNLFFHNIGNQFNTWKYKIRNAWIWTSYRENYSQTVNNFCEISSLRNVIEKVESWRWISQRVFKTLHVSFVFKTKIDFKVLPVAITWKFRRATICIILLIYKCIIVHSEKYEDHYPLCIKLRIFGVLN